MSPTIGGVGAAFAPLLPGQNMNLQKVLQIGAVNRAKVCAKEYYIYRLLGFRPYNQQIKQLAWLLLKNDQEAIKSGGGKSRAVGR